MDIQQIGNWMGIFPATLGAFDNGDFEHDKTLDEMFGEGINSRSTTLRMLTNAGVPLAVAMRKPGFSEEEIEEAVPIKEKERAQMQAMAVSNNQAEQA